MPGPLLAALPWLVSGLATLGGGIAANASNKKRAQEQMAFQERMSSTSYQRSMEDMRMAGINPMLAYQQGGASSPGGAMPQMQDVLGPAVSTALHGKRLAEEIKSMKADRDLKDASTAKEWAVNSEQTSRAELNRELVKSEVVRRGAETQHGRLMMYEADSAGAQALKDRLDADRSATPIGRGLDWVKKFRESLVGSANILMQPGRGASSARSQGTAERQWLGGNR